MSKRSEIWMRFCVADYVADTLHLSTVEHGAYLLLIIHYWRRGPLPDDDVELARVVRMNPDAWMGIAPRIRAFFSLKSGRLFHKRIEAEKARAETLTQRRAVSGQKGGFAKAGKSFEKQGAVGNCQLFATDLLQQNPRESESDIDKKKVPSLRSGGDPPLDAKAQLWKEGLASLMNLIGATRKQAAAQLGKLSDAASGDHSLLLAIIRDAEARQPDQPYAWIMGAVKARLSPGLFDAAKARPDDPWGLNAWIAKQPDVEDGCIGDQRHKAINGFAIDHYAGCIADAARLPSSWRGNWDCLGKWLREDMGVIDERPVLDAVRDQAARMNGSIGSIAVFDSAVRSAASRCRGGRR